MARDPGFAPAWALLAQHLWRRIQLCPRSQSRDPRRRRTRGAHRVTLDPRLPAGHMALAHRLLQPARSRRGRCAALDNWTDVLAGDAAYWHLLGFIGQREGRWRDAEAAFAKAFDLDAPATAEWLAVHFLHLRHNAGRPPRARRAPRHRIVSAPSYPMRGPVSASAPTSRAPVRCLEVALVARTPPDARVLGLLARSSGSTAGRSARWS